MSENEATPDFQQLIKEDMARFLAANIGRPAYDREVRGKKESWVAAAREIHSYLSSGEVNIIRLGKMMDYTSDVYDQGICSGFMRREYSQEGLQAEEGLFRDVRQGIISFMKTYRPESWSNDNWQAFKRLFNTVLPRRLEPSELRLVFWRFIYGEDTTEEGLPSKMPRQKQETWIRYQLEKMKPLTN